MKFFVKWYIFTYWVSVVVAILLTYTFFFASKYEKSPKIICGKVPYHYVDMEGFMSVKIIENNPKEFYAFINAKYRRIYNEEFNKYISANIISSECVKE